MNVPSTAIVASALMLISNLSAQDRPGAADLIILDATIHTLDPAQPRAQAMAVQGNRVVAVGSDASVRALSGPHTRIIHVRQRLVLPGFNDAHVHFLHGGFELANVDLRDAKTEKEFVERIRRFSASLPPGRWITGGNWDHEQWPGGPLPVKEWIDPVTPDRPVFVSRLDGHMALANSQALRLAGVTRESQDPPGGWIVRDPRTGEPTGVLKDAAMGLVSRKIPPRSSEEKRADALAATAHAASLGVTSVQDMSADQDIVLYQELQQLGKLKTRIYAVSPLPSWERLSQAGVRAAFGNGLVRIGGLKGFSDGSLGSSTAYFFEPYLDDPSQHGLPGDEMFPEGAMLKRVLEADRAGLQVMVHAIGDRANDQMLSIFESVTATNGPRDRRFRIEHAQHLRRQDLERFRRIPVIASMQPYHAADDGRWAEKRIGPTRAQKTYAFRSLLEAGARLAFGSDWPVAPLNPLLGIGAAVTRRTLDGKHPDGWVPEQKITVAEAVRSFTVGSAYAEFADDAKGTLTPGKLADFVILSHDIMQGAPETIDYGTVKVLLTVMDGRIVHELVGTEF